MFLPGKVGYDCMLNKQNEIMINIYLIIENLSRILNILKTNHATKEYYLSLRIVSMFDCWAGKA